MLNEVQPQNCIALGEHLVCRLRQVLEELTEAVFGRYLERREEGRGGGGGGGEEGKGGEGGREWREEGRKEGEGGWEEGGRGYR